MSVCPVDKYFAFAIGALTIAAAKHKMNNKNLQVHKFAYI